MAGDALSDGARRLFAVLPNQSALRKPLARVLLDGLTADEFDKLHLKLKFETVKRYRNEDVDLAPLLVKRREVADISNKAFEEWEAIVEQRIVNECGMTKSGQLRSVFKTELAFNQLFCQYQDHVSKPKQVSINVFARLAKGKHVHFGVGAVDAMTCVNCRQWMVEKEELEDTLLSEISARHKERVKAKLAELTEKLDQHQEALVWQRHAWKSDLDEVVRNQALSVCVVDYSTSEDNMCLLCCCN